VDVVDVFAAEARAVEAAIRRVPAEAWGQPGLGSWSVAELVAHLVRAADRVPASLAVPLPDGTDPAVDAVGYLTWTAEERAELAVGVAQRSVDDAARIGVDGLPGAFAEAWRETVRLVGANGEAVVLETLRGPVHLGEYLALGWGPAPTAEGLAMAAGLLDRLLGGPRPAGLAAEDVPFVLAATGREPHDDPRLPVLS
jgi:hypothetical protein